MTNASIRDLLDSLWPTTAVGLANDDTTDREVDKHFFRYEVFCRPERKPTFPLLLCSV